MPITNTSRYQTALDAAVDAAREAGKLIRDDFHRPGGPRGSGGHAEVDEEAEQVIREKILAAFPAAYRGEETGTASGGDGEHTWLVDPNDGTSAYLKGWRGSASQHRAGSTGRSGAGCRLRPHVPRRQR
jgi:ADP-ribosyl-[dinitrogen reductase] hydrolase